MLLTNGDFGGHIPRISHGEEYGPIAVYGDGHQTEYRDGTQHNQQGDSKQTGVQMAGQANTGQQRAGDANQAYKQVSGRQGHYVVVGAAPQALLPAEGYDDKRVAYHGAQGDQNLADGVGQVEPGQGIHREAQWIWRLGKGWLEIFTRRML